MFNNILTIQKTARLTCSWVHTGNPQNPLACVWAETTPQKTCKQATSSTDESGRLLLCA